MAAKQLVEPWLPLGPAMMFLLFGIDPALEQPKLIDSPLVGAWMYGHGGADLSHRRLIVFEQLLNEAGESGSLRFKGRRNWLYQGGSIEKNELAGLNKSRSLEILPKDYFLDRRGFDFEFDKITYSSMLDFDEKSYESAKFGPRCAAIEFSEVTVSRDDYQKFVSTLCPKLAPRLRRTIFSTILRDNLSFPGEKVNQENDVGLNSLTKFMAQRYPEAVVRPYSENEDWELLRTLIRDGVRISRSRLREARHKRFGGIPRGRRKITPD